LLQLSFGKTTTGHRIFGYFDRNYIQQQIGRRATAQLDEAHYLCSGINGSVYLVGNDTDRAACKGVIKLGTGTDPANLVALQCAAMIGLAPRVHLIWRCSVRYAQGQEIPEESIHDEVDFIAMDRLDGTLQELLEDGTVTEEDARAIYDLLDKFYLNNFMHHDCKPDNIGYKTDRSGNGRRRFFVIDFDFVWHGGPPMRLPYNWDSYHREFREPRDIYNGWSGSVPSHPVRHWDFCQLTHFVWISNRSEKNRPFLSALIHLAAQHAHFDHETETWLMYVKESNEWAQFPAVA
jgi:hypothetical protein